MPRRLIVVTSLLALVVLALGLAYAKGSFPSARSDVAAMPVEPTPEPELTALPVEPSPAVTETETTAPSPSPSPSPEPSPTPTELTPEQKAAIAARRAEIELVQTRLTELRYYAGAIDGDDGPKTRAAVMAFQKVNGLGADGVAGPKTIAALDAPVAPTLKGGKPDRIEVDLTRQVAYVVKGGRSWSGSCRSRAGPARPTRPRTAARRSR